MHHHQRYPMRQIVVCALIILLYLAYRHQTRAQAAIVVTCGQDAAAIINAAPSNAVITFQACTYPLTRAINPKAGQVIEGDGLVVLTGARTLTQWNRDSAGRWYVTGQTQEGKRTTNDDWTVCSQGFPRCYFPEDVFVNRVPQKHVAALSDVKAGCKCFHFDYPNDRIYVGDDPTGRSVQTSVTPQAITSSAQNVTLRNLTIEMFASPTQDAALQANGNGWHLTKITATLNHGAGVLLRGTSSMRDSDTSTNGQLGWKVVGLNNGQAIGTVIGDPMGVTDDNVCNFNNYTGVDQYFEAGCSKAVRTTDLQVVNNTCIGNLAKCFWTDIDNIGTYYADNYIAANLSNGIYHEISQGATIVNNTLICNGTGGSGDGGYFSAINATNTVDVLITGNYIEVCDKGNGISIRGDGSRPDYPSNGNIAVNNTIVARNERGRLANLEAVNGGKFPTNTTIAGNTYYVQNVGYKHWRNASGVVDFATWAAPLTGEVQIVGLPEPTPEPIPATPTPEATKTAVFTPSATLTPTAVETPEMTPSVTPARILIIRIVVEEYLP